MVKTNVNVKTQSKKFQLKVGKISTDKIQLYLNHKKVFPTLGSDIGQMYGVKGSIIGYCHGTLKGKDGWINLKDYPIKAILNGREFNTKLNSYSKFNIPIDFTKDYNVFLGKNTLKIVAEDGKFTIDETEHEVIGTEITKEIVVGTNFVNLEFTVGVNDADGNPITEVKFGDAIFFRGKIEYKNPYTKELEPLEKVPVKIIIDTVVFNTETDENGIFQSKKIVVTQNNGFKEGENTIIFKVPGGSYKMDVDIA